MARFGLEGSRGRSVRPVDGATRAGARLRSAAAGHRRLLRGVAWLGALVPVVLVVASAAGGASPASSRCTGDELPVARQIPATGKGAVLTSNGEGFRFHFGDARDDRADVVVLSDQRGLLMPGDRVFASMSNYLRSNNWTILPARDSTGLTTPRVLSRITPTHAVEVCVEIDAHAVGAHPGHFVGSVGLVGDDLDVGSTVPVDVTFRASREVAIVLAFAGVALGLLVKMLTELAAANRSRSGTLSIRAYLRDWSFLAAVVLGAITGWLGYVEIYGADPVWGDSNSDWLKLFGTCFAFQLASIGGIDLARRLVTAG